MAVLDTKPLEQQAAAAPDEYVKSRFDGGTHEYYHETVIGDNMKDIEVRYDRRKHRIERVAGRCDENHETFRIVPK